MDDLFSKARLFISRYKRRAYFDTVAGGVVNSAIALADARGIHKATGSGQLNGE